VAEVPAEEADLLCSDASADVQGECDALTALVGDEPSEDAEAGLAHELLSIAGRRKRSPT